MPNVSIDRLSLHLSGLSESDGRHLARLIADRLATASVPESATSRDTMRSNITARPGGGMRELSEQIVSDLVRQLERSF